MVISSKYFFSLACLVIVLFSFNSLKSHLFKRKLFWTSKFKSPRLPRTFIFFGWRKYQCSDHVTHSHVLFLEGMTLICSSCIETERLAQTQLKIVAHRPPTPKAFMEKIMWIRYPPKYDGNSSLIHTTCPYVSTNICETCYFSFRINLLNLYNNHMGLMLIKSEFHTIFTDFFFPAFDSWWIRVRQLFFFPNTCMTMIELVVRPWMSHDWWVRLDLKKWMFPWGVGWQINSFISVRSFLRFTYHGSGWSKKSAWGKQRCFCLNSVPSDHTHTHARMTHVEREE